MAETVGFVLQAVTAAAAGVGAYKTLSTKAPKKPTDPGGGLAAQQSNQIADQAEADQRRSQLARVRGRRGLLAYSAQAPLANTLGGA